MRAVEKSRVIGFGFGAHFGVKGIRHLATAHITEGACIHEELVPRPIAVQDDGQLR